jgi:ribosomal protein S18 acetylase RimI-like enzyme
VFVRPAWRGRDVARSMLAEALRVLRQMGLHEARLSVRATNMDALRVYLDLGYTVAGETRFYARDL